MILEKIDRLISRLHFSCMTHKHTMPEYDTLSQWAMESAAMVVLLNIPVSEGLI